MKITMESTEEFICVSGKSMRIWKGVTGRGTPVEVVVASVLPPDGAEAEMAEDLVRTRELWAEEKPPACI